MIKSSYDWWEHPVVVIGNSDQSSHKPENESLGTIVLKSIAMAIGNSARTAIHKKRTRG